LGFYVRAGPARGAAETWDATSSLRPRRPGSDRRGVHQRSRRRIRLLTSRRSRAPAVVCSVNAFRWRCRNEEVLMADVQETSATHDWEPGCVSSTGRHAA
jgi:hypothetical protein